MRARCFQFLLFSAVAFLGMLLPAPPGQARGGDAGGGALVVGVEANPTNLDPRLALDVASARVNELIYDKLIRLDESSQFAPGLALSWEMRDPLTYVFHLRQDATFHDGHPLTAEDVRYTFDSLRGTELNSPLRGSYRTIQEIRVLDPYTVEFRLHKPFASLLVNLVQEIVPRHLAEDPAWSLSRHPVGSGPFRFVEWVADERVELEANPQYHEGAPLLGRLIYRIIPDSTVRVLELESGGIDLLVTGIPPDLLPRLSARKNLRVETRPGTTYSYLGFNLRDPILTERAVRAAIAQAIDREGIIANLWKGLARPALGILTPEHWAYEGDVETYEYSSERAKALLDAAGHPDPDGEGPGARFELEYKTSQDELTRRIAEVIQANLRAVGIGVSIRSYEWGTFFSDIRNGNFQLYSLRWVNVTDPDHYYYAFHSTSVPPAGANRGYYQNPILDRLLEDARSVDDLVRRKDLYAQIQKIVAYDLPYVNLWHSTNVAVMRDDLEGFVLTPDANFSSLPRVRFR